MVSVTLRVISVCNITVAGEMVCGLSEVTQAAANATRTLVGHLKKHAAMAPPMYNQQKAARAYETATPQTPTCNLWTRVIKCKAWINWTQVENSKLAVHV